MTTTAIKTFALMGQPNTGKSTVFNALTGARQHVGNWPGKTVERKEGSFTHGGKQYKILDLPGTYSLLANSDEEVITREALVQGDIDVTLAILDASQLERSMFLLSDYAGIEKPVIVLLNMVDVAEGQGKNINADMLSKALGVPVLPVVATRKDGLTPFFQQLEDKGIKGSLLNTEKLESIYSKVFGDVWSALLKRMPELPARSRFWLAAKLLEGDMQVAELVRENVGVAYSEIESLLKGQKDGLLTSSDCKFSWIHNLVEMAVTKKADARPVRSRFDTLATSRFWGKLIAVSIILGGLIVSMIIGMPIMLILQGLQGQLLATVAAGLEAIGTTGFLVSLICEALIPAVIMAVSMASYVFGISLTFGFIEEIGYMARISYVFDSTMQRLGLHGKAVMPFLISFGCNIGGVAGTRVIDSWKQRLLAIATSWVVPCAGVWGVVALMGTTFFGGGGAVLIVLSLFAVAVLHMFITSLVFGRSLMSEGDRAGLIMELPPYHKPNMRTLLRFVWHRMKDVLFRALRLIVLVSLVFWALSYSPDGDVTHSVIYAIGKFIEPVTLWFGLPWQLFIAFISSGLGKEASLGVISALFTASGDMNLYGISTGTTVYASTGLTSTLLSSVTKPQALAFIFGFFFNMPCIVALGATASETHSIKWTVRIAGYYIGMALVMSFLAYNVGRLIF